MKRIIIILLFVLGVAIWQGQVYHNHKCTKKCKNIHSVVKDAYVPTDPKFGIGLVDVTHVAMDKGLPLYLARKCSEPVDTLKLIYGCDDNLVQIYPLKCEKLMHYVRPYALLSGLKSNSTIAKQPKMVFRVLAVYDNVFEILLDEHEKITAFIKIDDDCDILMSKEEYTQNSDKKNVLFETWEIYLPRLSCVFLNDSYLYNSIDGYGHPESITNVCCKINQVKGNWAEIVTYSDDDDLIQGWICWFDKNELQLTMFDD